MVGNHVSHGSGGFIEARPLFHTHRLGNGDLHVIDVIAIPQRLKNPVGEPLDHDVLDGFFAQKVVHPIDLIFVESSQYLLVEGSC